MSQHFYTCGSCGSGLELKRNHGLDCKALTWARMWGDVACVLPVKWVPPLKGLTVLNDKAIAILYAALWLTHSRATHTL